MRKLNLLLLSVALLFTLPVVLASIQNSIINVAGNDSVLFFNFTTTQVSTNPGIGEDVSYITQIGVNSSDADFNLSDFYFYLPENSSTVIATDFTLHNITNDALNATSFVIGDYNAVIFNNTENFFFVHPNASIFNITWKLSSPIAATKLATTRAGRAYTETWNITSAATNLTITNASLTVIPQYWYTRIGAPTTVTFNATAKDSASNVTHIEVWTDLNLNESTGNLIRYGSGYQTLSVTYNGPVVDASSGSSPSGLATAIPTLTRENLMKWFFIILGGLVVVGITVSLVLLLKKK